MLQAIIRGGIRTFASSPGFRLGELSTIDAVTEHFPRIRRNIEGVGWRVHPKSIHESWWTNSYTNWWPSGPSCITTLRSKDVCFDGFSSLIYSHALGKSFKSDLITVSSWKCNLSSSVGIETILIPPFHTTNICISKHRFHQFHGIISVELCRFSGRRCAPISCTSKS